MGKSIEVISAFIKKGLVVLNKQTGEYEFTQKYDILIKEESLSYQDVCVVPQFNPVQSRIDVDLKTKITKRFFIPSPMIIANMRGVTSADFIIKMWDLGISGALHRFYEDKKEMLKDIKKISDSGALPIASCGVKKEDYDLVGELIKNGAKIIIVDIAHGHSLAMLNMCKFIKTFYPHADVIAGNICTPEAVEYLHEYVDGLKCGISNGSICQTQHKTGAGSGQITSILECNESARQYGIPIISDGGISEPSDVVKSIIAGASSCMAGKIFARCPESDCDTIIENGKTYKLYYGMASNVLKNKIYRNSKKHVASEGIAVKIPIGAGINIFAPEFLAGIRSGFTYCGAMNIAEVHKNGVLRKTTQSSYEMGLPHAANMRDAEKVSN